MYVYPDQNNIAVFSPTHPGVEPCWEIDAVPNGSGLCMIDPNGEIYWTGAPSELESPQELPVESVEQLLVSALVE